MSTSQVSRQRRGLREQHSRKGAQPWTARPAGPVPEEEPVSSCQRFCTKVHQEWAGDVERDVVCSGCDGPQSGLVGRGHQKRAGDALSRLKVGESGWRAPGKESGCVRGVLFDQLPRRSGAEQTELAIALGEGRGWMLSERNVGRPKRMTMTSRRRKDAGQFMRSGGAA